VVESFWERQEQCKVNEKGRETSKKLYQINGEK
jgi:hypothetical protein